MGPMMGGPRPMRRKEEPIPKPKSIGGVPKYIGLLIKRAAKVVSGFFSRLFYIFGLVWETRPWILFVMLGLAIVEGVMPVFSSLVVQNETYLRNLSTISIIYVLIFLSPPIYL